MLQKGLYAAWGMQSEGATWLPDYIVPKMLEHGFKWLAYEVTPENDAHALAVKDACETRGIRYGVWQQMPGGYVDADWAVKTYQATFYIACIEGPYTFDPTWAGLKDKAVITNFDPSFDNAAWRDNGWVCHPEAYGESGVTVASAQNAAHWRGWDGLNSVTVEVLKDRFRLESYGPGWGNIYLAEGMTDPDWEVA